MKISKPTLLLDETKCKVNIKTMFDKATAHDLEFRPHFKTHQSLEIGSWFKEIGITKITVSSLTMAKYFSQEWDDITIAFPVNINEIELINELASKITINLCVENIESVYFLEAHLEQHINIFIKIDVGYHRTGINPKSLESIDEILDKVKSCPIINFLGFLAHSGHTYNCSSAKEIKSIHENSLSLMHQLSIIYKTRYQNLKLSLGDTPSCSIAENFEGINEIRPGNFVFYDLTQQKIGSNKLDQIAVAMSCPIVAIHHDRLEIVIYGGGVHFSKDRLETKNGITYGAVVQNKYIGWGNIIEGMYLKRLSQEHGIVAVPKNVINNYTVGDCITILPVHSCMTANLMKSYNVNNRVIERL